MKTNDIVVFDLDFTLWDAGGTWCDHTTGPYRQEGDFVRDAHGRSIYLYPDVLSILGYYQELGVDMAVASRTHSPEVARKLMNMFEIRQFFKYEEIYPGSKLVHFQMLKRDSGRDYNQMYFFDDEERNVYEVGSLGVHTFHVLGGLNWSDLKALERE